MCFCQAKSRKSLRASQILTQRPFTAFDLCMPKSTVLIAVADVQSQSLDSDARSYKFALREFWSPPKGERQAFVGRCEGSKALGLARDLEDR